MRIKTAPKTLRAKVRDIIVRQMAVTLAKQPNIEPIRALVAAGFGQPSIRALHRQAVAQARGVAK